MEELNNEVKRFTYDIDGLMELVKPYKISTDDIKVYDKKKKNEVESIFISIYRCYPKTHTTMEFCKEKNHHGDVITMSDKIFKANIPGLYRYCDESIDIILKWQKGHKLILDIDQELIRMNIHNIEKVKDYVIDLLDSQVIKDRVDPKDTKIIDMSNLKEMIKDGTGIEVPGV